MSKLLYFKTDEMFIKEVMVGDLKYHFQISYKDRNDTKDTMVYVIDTCVSDGYNTTIIFTCRDFNKSKIEIQTLDGSYMKVGTFYKPNIIHLDRVELQTYYFDETLTCIEDFESKVVEVELRTYMRFLGE